jgi:SAM-dependent methyltransferase
MDEVENFNKNYPRFELVCNEALAVIANDAWGAKIELDWLKTNSIDKHKSNFKKYGYKIFDLSNQDGLSLNIDFFNDSLIDKFDLNDCSSDFLKTNLSDKDLCKLNECNIFYAPPNQEAQESLKRILSSLEDEIEWEIGSKWSVVNVRSWKSRAGTSFGPSAWHIDGGARCMRKIMIYPNSLNIENGTIELFDRNLKHHIVASKVPIAILFDSAVLLHKGTSSEFIDRPVIEITFIPSEATSTKLIFSGQNARYLRKLPIQYVDKFRTLKLPSNIRPEHISKVARTLKLMAKIFLIKVLSSTKYLISYLVNRGSVKGSLGNLPNKNALANLNIGGGPNFNIPGWINLDGAGSELNPYPFLFSSTCIFPIPSGVVGLVYSSHCLEHLNDETVERVLQEAKRVLREDGVLVLKLPDFELALKSWKSNNLDYFNLWGLQELLPTWSNNNVEDTVDNRVSMIFCGYWNEFYGDHFSKDFSNFSSAYHGPAKILKKELQGYLSSLSCHDLSKKLV